MERSTTGTKARRRPSGMITEVTEVAEVAVDAVAAADAVVAEDVVVATLCPMSF